MKKCIFCKVGHKKYHSNNNKEWVCSECYMQGHEDEDGLPIVKIEKLRSYYNTISVPDIAFINQAPKRKTDISTTTMSNIYKVATPPYAVHTSALQDHLKNAELYKTAYQKLSFKNKTSNDIDQAGV